MTQKRHPRGCLSVQSRGEDDEEGVDNELSMIINHLLATTFLFYRSAPLTAITSFHKAGLVNSITLRFHSHQQAISSSNIQSQRSNTDDQITAMVSFNCAQFISIVVCTCAYMNIQAHHVTRSPDDSDSVTREAPGIKPTHVDPSQLKTGPGLPAGGAKTPEMSEASKAKFMEGIKAKAGAGGVPGAGPLTAPTGVNVNPESAAKTAKKTKRAETPSPAPASGKVPGGKPLTTDLIQPQNTPVPNGGMPKNGESVNQEVTPDHTSDQVKALKTKRATVPSGNGMTDGGESGKKPGLKGKPQKSKGKTSGDGAADRAAEKPPAPSGHPAAPPTTGAVGPPGAGP
ncbi:hypothetical protein PSHT_00676 [Puccinia striiformis]|uniref:Uncharacterized protein n=2 Tax=Puccinia striiformis TaxID=27350 RepID=A0A2S4WMH4_9BASI|nr:hypothetical protein PSHT_00676 [Puccinia striiformis]